MILEVEAVQDHDPSKDSRTADVRRNPTLECGSSVRVLF
jgi:hypothetical protein